MSSPLMPPAQTVVAPESQMDTLASGKVIGLLKRILFNGFPVAARFTTSVRVGSGTATLAGFDGSDGRVLSDGTLAGFVARDRTTTTSYVVLYKNGTIRLSSESGDVVLFDALTGQMTAAAGAGWTALPALQNGWVAFAGRTPSYRKNLLGQVELRGAISGGTATAGTLLWTMPAGFAPTMGSKSFAVASNAMYGEIRVDTGGLVNIFAGVNTILSLEGVRYETDA